MKINWKWLGINTAIAGTFGIITGKLVGYYNGKYEGALAKVEELAKEMSEKEIKMVPKEQLKKLAEDLEKMDVLARKAMDDQDEVIKIQGLKIQELENELKKYDIEDFKEWIRLKETFKVNKGAYGEWLLERDKQKKRQHEEEIVKKAIEDKDWDKVYNKTEHWYNHNPVDISRAEVFGKLETDGFITKEQKKEAHDYFKNLWFYVGD